MPGSHFWMGTREDNVKRCFSKSKTTAWSVAILFGLLAAGGAVAADWPQFQNGATRPGITYDAAPVTAPAVRWKTFTHYHYTHGIDVPAVIANGRAFVIDVDEYAWAFNADNGAMMWSVPLTEGNRFTLATPAYGDGKIFFATSTGWIYALAEEDGTVLWSGKLTQGAYQEEELSTQIAYDDGRVYVGSWEGVYYALDAMGDGGGQPKILFSYEISEGGYDWWSGPTVVGPYLLFGDTRSHMVCLDKVTGEKTAEFDAGQYFGVDAGSIRSAATYDAGNGRIYFTSKNGYLFAVGFDRGVGQFDGASGWVVPAGSYSASTPTFHDGRIYVCTGSFQKTGGLSCHGAADGGVIWQHAFDGYGSEGAPAISVQNGEAYIFISTDTGAGTFYCFDKDGNIRWSHVPDHPEYILQGAAIWDGKVYFTNDAGYIYCMGDPLEADVNRDGAVNVLDMIRLGQHWNQTGVPGWITEDVNADGVVNILDMIVVGQNWSGS